MNVEQLNSDDALVKYIKGIVEDKRYLELKDAFVAHSPSGNDTEGGIAVAHGKNLGTRYVFNEMEKIAKTPPPVKSTTNTGAKGKDPDLAT